MPHDCCVMLYGYAAVLVNTAHNDQFINMAKKKIKVYSNLKVNVLEVILVVNYESNGFQLNFVTINIRGLGGRKKSQAVLIGWINYPLVYSFCKKHIALYNF